MTFHPGTQCADPNAWGSYIAAAAEVAAILEVDTANVAALKLRAAWLIAQDKPDMAISDLRTALNQSPRDAEILTLMAEAHTRAGSPELAGERLALAVDVSGSAPDTALRYVGFLLQDNRRQAANDWNVVQDKNHQRPEQRVLKAQSFHNNKADNGLHKTDNCLDAEIFFN